jgi:hypothetical protein
MYEEDIKKQSWNVAQRIERTTSRLDSLTGVEQECHINIMRVGWTDETKGEIRITCSNQIYITELSKSEYFTLTGILVSPKGYVLEVRGTLELNGLTIRKQKHTFTEEEIKIRSERAKKNFGKKKL